MGFDSIDEAALVKRYTDAPVPGQAKGELFRTHSLENLMKLNSDLEGYSSAWYEYFDSFIQVRKSSVDSRSLVVWLTLWNTLTGRANLTLLCLQVEIGARAQNEGCERRSRDDRWRS